jgi:hypothetical protein
MPMKRAATLALLVVFGFGFGLVLSEASVRLLFPVSDFLWQWDPVIGMKLIPGKRGRSVKQGVYDVSVEVNSAGFRDREHAVEKPPGTYRIVLLGDSLVEAIQVPFEESVPALLESELQRRGVKAEVISLSVSGTGTAREYLTLREYGLRYQPDLVLLFFVGNDFSDNTRRLKGLSYIPYPQIGEDGDLARDEKGHPVFTPFADQPSRLGGTLGFLRDHSKSYRLVRETMDSLPNLTEILNKFGLSPAKSAAMDQPVRDDFGFYEVYRTRSKPEWAEATRVTVDLLVALRDLAKENSAEFGVVLVPGPWEVYPQRWDEVLAQRPEMRNAGLDLGLPARTLTELLAPSNVRVIELLSDFRARAGETRSLYLQDGHWTTAGHQLAADLISRHAASILSSEAKHRSAE